MSSSESNNESSAFSKKNYIKIKPADIKRERPKRSSSQNVDYNLKHRKIIASEDSNDKKKQKLKDQLMISTTNKPVETHYVKKPLFQTNSNGEIIGMNDDDEMIDVNQGNLGNRIEVQNNSSNLSSATLSTTQSLSPTPLANAMRHDVLNGATGLSLGQFPTEKIKKERLWNYKKISFTTSSTSSSNTILNQSQKTSNSAILVASPITTLEPIKKRRGRKKKIRNRSNLGLETWDSNSSSNSNSSSPLPNDLIQSSKIEVEERLYKSKLKTHESDHLTHSSSLRHILGNNDDIDLTSNDKVTNLQTSHHIISKPLSSKNKLFTTGTTASNEIVKDESVEKIEKNVEEEEEEENEIENDDFCSTCLQTGSFLCCDTCPKSFHFLCLDPPMDPNNLPEGDWSCPNCIFKAKFPNQAHYREGERQFINDRSDQGKGKLFSKLLFKLQSYNPKQFSLPDSIKDTFEDVKTGSHSQYNDETFKTPLTDRQLFNTSYGQSITKLDSYCPEIHYATNDDNPDKFLTCYKCHTTKFGSWDHPEESRLLIKCEYCGTPWHLDCIPNIPRASLKNLGYKWKCPLHANTMKERRLTKKQPFIKPQQSCGFKNNGDIEIILDEIISNHHKGARKIGDLDPIPILNESSIKIDFLDKIFKYKKLRELNEIKLQEHLIDKLISSHQNQNIQDISSLVYFDFCNNKKANEKLWNLRELCHLANSELADPDEEKVEATSKESYENNDKEIMLTSNEINELLMLKKLVQSKPKEDIIKFFGLE
ncbi:hypothetical protein C6P44_000819 [Monosporozyma unispora]|nr:hypothetical protein C6P44_000819 [Kazachstania unispora]